MKTVYSWYIHLCWKYLLKEDVLGFKREISRTGCKIELEVTAEQVLLLISEDASILFLVILDLLFIE